MVEKEKFHEFTSSICNRMNGNVRNDLPPCSNQVNGVVRSYPVILIDNDRFLQDTVSICIEEQIRISINDQHIATMVATPDELTEFAVGFVVDEGILRGFHEIQSVRVDGTSVNLQTVPGVLIGKPDIEVRSSGGLGNVKLDNSESPPLLDCSVFTIDSIFLAVDLLHDLSSTWKKTGGTHSAIILSGDNELVAYAEDMGRHTAIDKVIGKALMKGVSLSSCCLTCTGRLPAGMIQKAYRVGIPLIISNNAPFSSGIDLANQLNLTVVGFVRKPRATIYSGTHRIQGALQ